MKKILVILFMVISLISAYPAQHVKAIDCSGDRFSVDTIDMVNGTVVISNVACYALSEYTLAIEKMTATSSIRPNVTLTYFGDNPVTTAVVETDYSKIIASDRAMAYSQPYLYADYKYNASTGLPEYNSVYTMTIYPTSTMTGSSLPYIDAQNLLFYYGTSIKTSTTIMKPTNLSARISVNGAFGYVNMYQIQLIPLFYLDYGLYYPVDRFRNTDSHYGTLNIKARQTMYHVKQVTKTTYSGQTLQFNQLEFTTNYISNTDSRIEVGKAPDWLTIGSYYSPDGVTFFLDPDLTKPVYNGTSVGKFYNYYQYLNLRSKTSITANDLDTYISSIIKPVNSTMIGTGNSFINNQNLYGMNALMMFSMAALESGWGRSDYAQKPANLQATVVKDILTLKPVDINISVKTFCTLYNSTVFYDSNGVPQSCSNKSLETLDPPFVIYDVNGQISKITTPLEYCTQYNTGKFADENNQVQLCKGRYNIFSWGAYDSNPLDAKIYPSIDRCIAEQMGINLRISYMSYTGSNFYASNIGNKGAGINTRYPSDPWWGISISSIAYQIDRYFDFTEFDTTQLGILNPDFPAVFSNKELTGQPMYTIPSRAKNYPIIILEGLIVNGKLVYKVQTTNPMGINGSLITSTVSELVPFDFDKSIGYIEATQIESYVSKFVTGVTDQGLYNIDKQIFFTSGTAKLDGVTIYSGHNVSTEGVHTLIATSSNGVVQKLTFTIDKTAPIISLNNYQTNPTNQDITVTASVNEGTLDQESYTFTENGSYVFKATDAAGNVAEKTVTISNIDKTAPVITIGDFDAITISNTNITVTATTNEGTLNTPSHTFMRNGSFDFVATDAAGNVTTQTVTVTNIVKNVTLTYATQLAGGSLSASLGSTTLSSGATVTSLDQITVSMTLNPKYHVYRWLVNDSFVLTRATTLNVEYPYLDTTISAEFYYEGDLNDDGKMTTTDLVQLRRIIAGLDSGNEKAVLAADINGDGKVSTTDLVKIRRMLAGLE